MKAVFYSLCAMMLIACTKSKPELKTLIVADHREDCTGVGPQQCFLVKHQESENWQYFYGTIEGFDYAEGFEYVIEVVVYDVPHPPADASSKRYVLRRIIHKK